MKIVVETALDVPQTKKRKMLNWIPQTKFSAIVLRLDNSRNACNARASGF